MLTTQFEQRRGNIAQRNAQKQVEDKFTQLLEKSVEKAFDWALENNQEALCREALQQGASLETLNKRNNTRLHEAAINDDATQVRLLCILGAKVNAANREGNTPLMLAAQSNSPLALRELILRPGIDPDIKNKKNLSVLDYLCNHPNPNIQIITALDSCPKVEPSFFYEIVKPLARENKVDAVKAILSQKEWVKKATPNFAKALFQDAKDQGANFDLLVEIFYSLFDLWGIKFGYIIQNRALFDATKMEDLLAAEDKLSYLETSGLCSKVTIACLRLLKIKEDVKAMQEEQLPEDGEAENAMADKAVKMANKHFKETVEPYFREKFLTNARTRSDAQALNAIEREIRELILNEIDKKAIEENDEATRAFIKKQKNNLILGKTHAMKASLAVFNKHNSEQSAWRGYNPYAPTKEWQNLLTPCTSKTVYTTSAAFEGRLSGLDASTIVRKRVAFYYLAVMEGDDDALKANRIANFIDKLAEIRNTKGLDDPSCFPGTLTRVAQMGAFHDVAQLPPSFDDVLLDTMRGKVLTAFKEKRKNLSNEQKEALCKALTLLTQASAPDLIKDASTYPEHYLALRQEFIDSLGSEMPIFTEVRDQVEWEVENEELVLVTQHFVDVARLDIATVLMNDLQRELDSVPTQAQIEAANPFINNQENKPLFDLTQAMLKVIEQTLPFYFQSFRKLSGLTDYLQLKMPELTKPGASEKTLETLIDNLDGADEAKYNALQAFKQAMAKIPFAFAPDISNPYKQKRQGLEGQLKQNLPEALRRTLEATLVKLTEKQRLFHDFWQKLQPSLEAKKVQMSGADLLLATLTEQYHRDNALIVENIITELAQEPELQRLLKEPQVIQALGLSQQQKRKSGAKY